MACSDSNSFARQCVSVTASRFCQAVREERVTASKDVKIYIKQSKVQHIAEAMESALSPNFCSHLRHTGDLTCLPYGEVSSQWKALLTRSRLAALQEEVLVSNQGAHAEH